MKNKVIPSFREAVADKLKLSGRQSVVWGFLLDTETRMHAEIVWPSKRLVVWGR